MERAFEYCRAVEIPRSPSPYRITEHDDFSENLPLNDDAFVIGIARYALALVGKKPIEPIDTTGMEFIPERRHGI